MNCEEAIQYIHSAGYSSAPRLGIMTELLSRLGNPQDALSCIHIAGTNGKGSTSAMLSSVLCAAGYRTGLFTSPYLRVFGERIRVNGECIGEDALAHMTDTVKAVAETLPEAPTEFELINAIGFLYFKQQKVDLVVLEVGLGGRFDPTNVIKSPVLSIITGIDFDHTVLLGNTIQEIAAEKAGIIKEGRPCLYGGPENTAYRTIRAFAEHRHAPLHTVDRSLCRQKSSDLDGTLFDFNDLSDLKLPLLGAYQLQNATTVLTAVQILCEEGLQISESAVRQGLENTRWQARFELLSKEPTIIYDGGHNPDGVAAAVRSVKLYFPEQRVNILSGVMTDKDFDAMIEELKPVANQVFTVTPNNRRALPAAEYAAQFEGHKIPATAYESVEAGVRAAIAASRADGLPLICLGSLYLYAELSDEVARILAE